MRFRFLLLPRTIYCASAIVLMLAVAGVSAAQNLPLVIAWQAPDDTTPCPNGPRCFDNFIKYELPYISGIGITILWGDIDNCSLTAPCTEREIDDTCPSGTYQWCAVDSILVDYINQPVFANKKIVFIVRPTNDSGQNSRHQTPPYVFSTTWAGPSGANAPQPQDQIVCQGWQGDIVQNGSSSCPVRGTFVKGNPDFAIWNVSQCDPLGSLDLTCPITCNTPFTDISGFPIVYEKPFVVAYQTFLRALAHHYNPVTGSPNGRQIAPYIAYMRVGMANAGENLPQCATNGRIPQETWSTGIQVPAGYLVNTNNTQYVAIGAGNLGSTSQTCSPAGCNTAPDGTVPSWYNSGSYVQGSSGNRMWPGPAGDFSGEAQSYSDNGYLSKWVNISEGTGYIGSMAAFLGSLNASFSFDMSAHSGPPVNNNNSYPDSEAIIASTNGIGFGMQSVNVGDGVLYAAGTYPTSRENWAHNFRAYLAPVHHLQTNAPGSTYFAEGYQIDNIQVDATGNATIYCPILPMDIDCSPFSGGEIYIVGNSNNLLNGVWTVNCPGPNAPQCDPNTLQFQSNLITCPTPPSPCGTNGIVWGPEYWPIIMPFAVQHGVSSVEIWECSLDYAFGASPLEGNFPTTTWVSSPTGPSGCAEWGVVGPGPLGTDPGYQNAIADTQIGQPSATSVRTGKSIIVNGTQF